MEATEGRTGSPSQQHRRPLLQVVVLFAADARVAAYASRITHKFLDAGVDVYLQADLTESGLGVPGSPAPQYIKPSDLSSVIAASHGDFLIVLGDKNVKNETCQARQAGRLVERKVDESLVSVLESWAQQTGLRGGEGGANSDRAVAGLGEDALVDRLRRLVGAPNLVDRLGRVGREVGEVLELGRRPAAAAVGLPLLAAGGGGGGGGKKGGGALAALLASGDHDAVARLTRAQTSLVRLHRDVTEALAAVHALPVLARGAAAGPSAPGAPPALDLGLGPGVQVNANYRPNGSGPVSATGAALTYAAAPLPAGSGGAAGGAAAPAPIPATLRARLVALLEGYLARCEEDGSVVTDAAGGGGAAALWQAYLRVRSGAGERGGGGSARAAQQPTATPPPLVAASVLRGVAPVSSVCRPPHSNRSPPPLAGVQGSIGCVLRGARWRRRRRLDRRRTCCRWERRGRRLVGRWEVCRRRRGRRGRCHHHHH